MEIWKNFLSPVYVAALGLISGYILKWWTEKATREYDREAKRLQLFKAYYDLQALDKKSVSAEFDKRCQQLLRDAANWIESRPTKGASKAKLIAIWASIVSANYTALYLSPGTQKFIMQLPPDPPYLRTMFETSSFFGYALGGYIGAYSFLLPLLQKAFADLSGFRLFQHWRDTKW